MSLIIETDDLGQLTLSPDVLGHAKPHSRYEVDIALAQRLWRENKNATERFQRDF